MLLRNESQEKTGCPLRSLLASFLFSGESIIVAPKTSLKDGRTSFLLFVNDPPDALEALSLLFTHDVKMVTLRIQNMNLYSRLVTAWDWSQKWDLPINLAKCKYLTIGREIPLRLSFSPDGTGTLNVFSPSAQCTEAANKARRLILMIRCFF